MAHEYHPWYGITACFIDDKDASLMRVGYAADNRYLYQQFVYQLEGEQYEQTLKRAQAVRDGFLRDAFDCGLMCPERPGRSFPLRPGKKNVTGVVGVSLCTYSRQMKSSQVTVIREYHAAIRCNHQQYRKSFSIKNMGKKTAFEMAVEWRKNMEEKLLNPCRNEHRETA